MWLKLKENTAENLISNSCDEKVAMLKKKIMPNYSFQKFWFGISEFSEVYSGVGISIHALCQIWLELEQLIQFRVGTRPTVS